MEADPKDCGCMWMSPGKWWRRPPTNLRAQATEFWANPQYQQYPQYQLSSQPQVQYIFAIGKQKDFICKPSNGHFAFSLDPTQMFLHRIKGDSEYTWWHKDMPKATNAEASTKQPWGHKSRLWPPSPCPDCMLGLRWGDRVSPDEGGSIFWNRDWLIQHSQIEIGWDAE